MRRLAPACVALVLCCGLVGCGESSASRQPSADGERRIVSLAPAITRMLIELGVEDQVVAVADYDNFQSDGVPSVGNYLDINAERLIAVKPTHVFVMVGKEGVPRQLERLREELGFALHEYPSPDDFETMMGVMAKVGDALSMSQAAAERVRGTVAALDDAQARAERADGRPRVLVLLSANPPMASGPGTPNHDLINRLNAVNAVSDATVGAPVLDREKLIAAAPGVVILMEPAAAEPAVQRVEIEADPDFVLLRGLPIDAVTDGNVYRVSDPYILLPGVDSPRTARLLLEAIHGIESAPNEASSPAEAASSP